MSESYEGVVLPEMDSRDLRSILIPKVIAAKDRFDVNFVPDYKPPEVGPWLDTENKLPGPLEPYFLRANTGPRWMLGGAMSRPFINASQCSEKFAISSIEGSSAYKESSPPLARWLTFPSVDHCFLVQEGLLKVILKGDDTWTSVREGQTLVISAGQAFAIAFGSRYVRAVSFTNGRGIEELIQTAGTSFSGFVLPEEPVPWEESRLQKAAEAIGVQLGENVAV